MLPALSIALIILSGIVYYSLICLTEPFKRNGRLRLGMRIVNASRRIHEDGKR